MPADAAETETGEREKERPTGGSTHDPAFRAAYDVPLRLVTGPAPSVYENLQRAAVANGMDYQKHRNLDNTLLYAGGHVVHVFEHALPHGLLGYTDTRSEIHLTHDELTEQFGIPKRRVLWHELNHFGQHDELKNRYAEHNAWKEWDLNSGAPPLEAVEADGPRYRTRPEVVV